MEKNSILLVEDDFLNRRQTKKILLEIGYEIFEAKNAKEAFAILRSNRITLAILDIHLGEEQQDGISIGQEIQKNYELPFVYLTAYDNAVMIKNAVSTSPSAYLTKPFKNIDLITCVQLAISKFIFNKRKTNSVLVKDGEYSIDLPLDMVLYI